jgi:hypothetical protein
MTHLIDTISSLNLHAASRAYYDARDLGLSFTEYDADRIGYWKTPVAEVRAEADRQAKAQKAVAKRIACERKVIRFAVRHILAQGYVISVYDGEDSPVKKSASERAIMAAVQACDEEWLIVWKPVAGGLHEGVGVKHQRMGTIALVYGNSGPEVICDYHTSLEALMEPVNAYCDKLEA